MGGGGPAPCTPEPQVRQVNGKKRRERRKEEAGKKEDRAKEEEVICGPFIHLPDTTKPIIPQKTPSPGEDMASPLSPEDHWTPKPAPAKPLTDLDFRSGERIEELNQLIQEYEARNLGTIRDAPELHQARDHVFSLLGLVHKSDRKLPQVNQYLILSGGVQDGTVNINLGHLDPLSPGSDYDAAFTLLVPVLNAAGVPVTLDMKQSPPGHTRFSLRPFEVKTSGLWSECCLGNEDDLAADRVAEWFFHAFATCVKDERVEKRGCITSVIVSARSLRILYDIIPVVALKGWPEVARPWLTQAHFWDGKLKDEDVAGGFYLLPSSGADWRLAFSSFSGHLSLSPAEIGTQECTGTLNFLPDPGN
ncbi:transmembrane protein 102 isoform X3 [Sceloporus undulatus]|uniref:transmembrane protein 102 isoform X3 n=1 Tax=Sceloporus undulatus TaxID=8520 RepID=UPI001C4CA607|nr:transmembrane protein 102 isoform X3 [Sceloporus undulatus]